MTKNQKTIAIVGGVALLLFFLMKKKGAEKSLEEGVVEEGESEEGVGGGGGGGFGGGSPVGLPIGSATFPPVTIVNNPPEPTPNTQPTYVQVGENAVALRETLSVRPQKGGGSVTNISTQTAGRGGNTNQNTPPTTQTRITTDSLGNKVSVASKFAGFDANMRVLDSLM
jgi:hypothetical protein